MTTAPTEKVRISIIVYIIYGINPVVLIDDVIRKKNFWLIKSTFLLLLDNESFPLLYSKEKCNFFYFMKFIPE